jgi:hypothetical protein
VPSQEAFDHVDRLVQHVVEVKAGLIPENSPPTWIRSDWRPDASGKPGWFGPDYHLDQQTIDSVAEATAEQTKAASEG